MRDSAPGCAHGWAGARLRRLNMGDAVLLPTGASVFEIYDLVRRFRFAAMELRRVA